MAMELRQSVKAIKEQEWLDDFGDKAQKGVRSVLDSAGPSSQGIKNLLHGAWLGHPLHPVLTDIPIGAWTSSFAFDFLEMLGIKKAGGVADATLGLGLVAATVTAAAGIADWSQTDGKAKRVGLVHGLLNVTATAFYLSSLLARIGGDRGSGRLFALLGLSVASYSAYLGGELVYGERIGINHASSEVIGPLWQITNVSEDDLVSGEPKKVEVDGKNVMLFRQGERIVALCETCPHLGGPLSEGKVEGDSITCPWHGSTFSLEDGHVINGPSAYPAPHYETRTVAGNVEVRAASEE